MVRGTTESQGHDEAEKKGEEQHPFLLLGKGRRRSCVLEKWHLRKPVVICRNNLKSFHTAEAVGRTGLSLETEDNLTPVVPCGELLRLV